MYHSVKVLSTAAGYSLGAMLTDLCHHFTHDLRGAWHMYAMLLSDHK